MTERRSQLAVAATALRYLGALALLAVGVDHIDQYYADYYRAIPTIGTLFVLNFASALIISLALFAPVRRLAGRHADRILVVLAISGIGIGAGTLAGLLVSENGGLFGFVEVGYRGAIVLSVAFDVATVVLLSAFLVLLAVQRRRRPNPPQHTNLHRPVSRVYPRRPVPYPHKEARR